jgi:hypothetical protein
MLTFRDAFIIAAIVGALMWWFKRKCGCGPVQYLGPRQPEPRTAAPAASMGAFCGRR